MSESLLYTLRSPTTPLGPKLALARAALAALTLSPLEAAQLRDWTLDALLRARREPILLDRAWWAVLDDALAHGRTSPSPSPSPSPTPTLPIFVAFVRAYAAASEPDDRLVTSVLAVFRTLAAPAMKKATLDQALDAYAALLTASVRVVARGAPDLAPWEQLAELWTKAFRTVVDSAKGGKKIPLHTLANLPAILALLPVLRSTEPFLPALLQTIQFTLFNVENLRRGIARESYTAAADESESASSELLNALKALLSTQASLVHDALPLLFALYRSSLATHATALFPLPAKTSFATASAYRSASELHAFQKRRALAAGWVRGVVALLSSSPSDSATSSLARTLIEVERGDLFVEDVAEWTGVLPSIVDGALARLPPSTALLELLSPLARLSFESIEPALPAILAALATLSESSPASETLLVVLLTHHSRSHALPSLLQLLSTALSSPTALPTNALTTHSFTAALSTALAALVGPTVRSSWTELTSSLVPPGPSTTLSEPEKKRRKVDLAVAALAPGAAARARLLTLFVRALPSPVPVDLFDQFRIQAVDPAVKELAKGREVALGAEMLAVRYAMLERIRREGASEDRWDLGEKRRMALLALLGQSEQGEVVLVLASTLLQSLSAGTDNPIISALLLRLFAPDPQPWSGHARGMSPAELPAALWELLARRWMHTLEQHASDEQLNQVAQLIVRCMGPRNESSTHELSLEGTTERLLRHADFYELRRLQAHIHPALLARVTLPSLLAPSSVLVSLAAPKLPKALRSLDATEVALAVSTVSQLARLVPTEYLSKGLRNDLVDRALALDVWITACKTDSSDDERERSLVVLRTFVRSAAAVGSPLTDGPVILAHLVAGTGSTSPALTNATMALYRHFVQSSVIVYAGDKVTAPLEAYLSAFDAPLASLAKRAKKGPAPLDCSELAFFAFCDVLSTSLGEFASIPESLQSAITALATWASKPLAKTLAATTASLASTPSGIWLCAPLIESLRQFWALKDWIFAGECDQVEVFASFAESTLAALVAQPAAENSLRTSLAMLDLVAFRLDRLRQLSDPNRVETRPFESFLACHLAFRSSLREIPGASRALLGNLKLATLTSTLREYKAALSGLATFIGEMVAAESENEALEPALEVALVLLRDGPPGSSRMSTEALSDVLRHLSLRLTRLQDGKAQAGPLFVVSTFLEGICGERPMLLSRQNVSSVLTLVARMLHPSGLHAAPPSPTPAALTSSLFLSLVTTVDHLVRHRKDHITPLFPSLVATLSPILSALRLSGFGTTGSSSNEVESANVGKRAEREARATFPSWVWDGGPSSIGRTEARAVGRLLAGLSAKTASTSLKRKHGEGPEAAGVSSLAAPLSKHAPFILLPYLRACVSSVAPIPAPVRGELMGGWFEVMDAMGKWEKEALMKGFLADDEEAERGVLRGMWRTWEKERYRG